MKRRSLLTVVALLATLLASRSAWGVNVLLLTDSNGSLTTVESNLKANLQAAGYTVNTLWDGDTQANYTAAFANNDCVYIPSDVSTTDMANKLRTCPIGIVNEIPTYMDKLGFCTAAGTTTTSSTVTIATNTHYVTSPFATGTFTMGSTTYTMPQAGGTTASGAVVLATVGSGSNCMIAIDTGGTLANTISSNSTASGRRIQMPLQCGVINVGTLSTDAQTLLPRIVLWAALAEGKLEARWKLDETSGTSAADSSGNSKTGTVTGTPSWGLAVLNNGFTFDGATKIQATGLMGNPRNVSVAAWAKLTAADTTGSEIVSLGDHFLLRLDDSGVAKASFYNGSAYVTASFSAKYAGTGWHHFAAVFDDGHDKLMLYIDGSLVTTTTTTASISWAGLGTNTVVGQHGNGSTASDFTGTLDEVRVYSYAISSTEVAQMFGLVGQWKLNETSGTTAKDNTVFKRDGTLTGTAAWSSDCGGMPTFDFNGSTNYLTVANAADFQQTTTLSVSAWIKGDTWGSGTNTNTILRKGDTSPNNFALQIADGKVELLLDGSDGSGIRGNTVLSTGVWYHVAATWDGTTAKIYVNGVLDNSPGASKASPIGTDTRPLYIGGRSGGCYFDGMVREVRLYNRVLLSSEIVQGAGLVGWWKFAEGSGSGSVDSSGMGNNVTLAGSAAWTSDCAGNNNALQTNGAATGTAVTTAAFNPPDVGTVTMWVRSTGNPSGTARIIGLGGDWEVRQQPDGTVVTDLCGDGATTICTITPLSEVGRWYHLAFTFDSATDTYAIYVDGQLERSGVNPVNMVQQPSAALSFGTRTGATECWSGAIRDVRVYNRKLCPTEIASIYGLLLYMKLDETSGTTAADSSGLGNNGTYVGATLGANAPRNFGAYFPSDNKYMIAPASGSLNSLGVSNADFTVAFYVKPATPPGGWRPLFHKGGADFDRSPGIWLNPGDNRVHFRNTTTSNNNEGTDSSVPLTSNVWSHVACVKSGNKWRCYINATLDTEYTLSGNTTGNNGPLYLGDDPWYPGSNVYMDEVRIYNRALCPTEIQQIKNLGNAFGGVKVTKWYEIQ